MTRGLTGYVYLEDEGGKTVAFGPGDAVPDWAQSQITNPAAWDRSAVEAATDTAPAGDDGAPSAPKGNASREEWAAYADSLGVTYDAEAKREDIKAAVEAATEQ